MDPLIRPAQSVDRDAIAPWTADTFSWGDYVSDRFDDWLGDPNGQIMVAEVDGDVVAVAYAVMVSSQEAWAQGMRVHPDHRRSGIGTAVGEALWDWARHRGAAVIRLVVEKWNEPAQGQVDKMGFRPVCDWFYAERGVGDNSPVPEGNGGRRVPAEERLRPANTAEAEPAFLSWATSDLAATARGMFARHWVWLRLTEEHLKQGAKDRTLWSGRPGWALAEADRGHLSVHWLETAETDARAMVRALIDRAADGDFERVTAMIPAVGWLRQAFERSGFELNPLTVWTKTL